ncbi:unnamed protein product [Zymoseptoria tritici ST99CH_3D7]|uniref:BTB domain-containing protein n=1 Tax=Zymoseptoria tritici (strain ST99CH_3D7) TaxID=1276538 RepID=A0A1X7RP45_ZYMT9|nr:unnamed protein product [Zymoseptoria tritici ST99CH_3D7]
MSSYKGALVDGLTEFLATGTLSDFTIKCGTQTFKVHKVVLAAQSEYFKAAVRGQFKESSNASIDLKAFDPAEPDYSCDDPLIVKAMIDFLYRHSYTFEHDLPPVPEKRKTARPAKHGKRRLVTPEPANTICMVEHAKVFAMACKYGIPELKREARDQFIEAVADHWSHESFAQAIEEVYHSTSEGVGELREVVVKTILDNHKLLEDKNVEAAISSIDGLAYNLLKQSAGRAPARSYERAITPIDLNDLFD